MKKDSSIVNDKHDPEATDEFDPSLFDHTKLGVWDLYVKRTRLLRYLPTSRKIEEYAQIWKDIQYLWRTLSDMSTVALPLLLLYMLITVVGSLIPALSLWCMGLFSTNAEDAYIFSRFSGQVLGSVSIYLPVILPSLIVPLWPTGAISHRQSCR
jgi:hypothetical protein